MEKLGEKIYLLRKERGLSQEELADKLNVSRQSVSKWETDQSVPDYDNVAAMCAFFGVSLDGFTGNGCVGEAADVAPAAEVRTEADAAESRGVWKKILLSTFLFFFAAVGFITFLSFAVMAFTVGRTDPQFVTMVIPLLGVSYAVLFTVVLTVVIIFYKKSKKPRG